jgi:hypothetical protein
MNKPVLGLLLGSILGLIDGASAWFYGPDVQAQIVGIVIGSTFKGLVTGWLAGFFATKVRSLPLGIGFGLLVGLALSFAVASMGDEQGKHYYWEIMLPGALLGLIVGFVTQRSGRARSAV